MADVAVLMQANEKAVAEASEASKAACIACGYFFSPSPLPHLPNPSPELPDDISCAVSCPSPSRWKEVRGRPEGERYARNMMARCSEAIMPHSLATETAVSRLSPAKMVGSTSD